MDNELNPGSRPRRGVSLVLVGLLVLAIIGAAAVVATPEKAEAAGLEPFTSCRELSAWGVDAGGAARFSGEERFQTVGDAIAADGAGSSAMSETALRAPATTVASGANKALAEADAALDATNVVVDGVDELDLIDRLGGDQVLVVAGEVLAIVDLGDAQVVAKTSVPFGAQVTYDREAGRAWVVGQSDDGSTVRASRVDVGDASLEPAGIWSAPGTLVDARRAGGTLYLVASDGFVGNDGPRPPFGGGPVPCDEVLRPAGPSDATASLIVALPVTGELQPVHATEVVGSGQFVHVTDTAAYLATPQWAEDGTSTTGIHRFDLATLDHTGSGSVPGSLLNDFSMSEHDGHLRVAITARGGVGFAGGGLVVEDMGEPIPVERFDPVEPSAGDIDTSSGSSGSDAVPETTIPARSQVSPAPPETTVAPAPEQDPAVPGTAVPEPDGTTTTTVDTTTSTTSTSTTSTSTSTTSTSTSTTSTSTTTTAPQPTGVTIPGPGPGDPFNKVVVLDTEGSLDVVGSTPWFGLPGESLEGIRFDGDTAYAVTFLQTDPFYVLDLADPLDPKVAGEVKLPGFSAYLHPVGGGRVVGFGPDGNGKQAAKLFDVSDPAKPQVVDTLILGDDSPVVYDHHAFVSLGEDRFAVPVTDWSAATTRACELPENPGPAEDYACAPGQMQSAVVEIEAVGNELQEVERVTVTLPEQVSRALPIDGGWAMLAGSKLALVDDDSTVQDILDL